MQGELNEGKAGSARCNKEYQVKCRKNTEQATTKIQSKMSQITERAENYSRKHIKTLTIKLFILESM